jgi:hypothetical protein
MTETTLPPWQATRLAVLLDALGGVPLSDVERRSLVWLAGFETARQRVRAGTGLRRPHPFLDAATTRASVDSGMR